jgi:hypothetical protein
MTRQAAKGGEVGANGEFYAGGRFVNTIAENPKIAGSKPRKARKVEIEPYVWVIAEPGQASIYQRLAGIFGRTDDAGRMVIQVSQQTLDYYRETLAGVQDLADRYNAGERWL